MKRIWIAGAFALAIGGPALAADLPQPMPPPPRAPATYVPVAVPYYNWGGIYFGVNAGYAFGNVAPTGFTNFSASGFLVGPTIGFNFQAGAFVFGIEGDIDYSGVTGNIPGGGTFDSRWIGTVRGRGGYAIDRVLLYLTGGGAFANAQIPGATATGTGWTAGGGIEFALAQNWTAKAEYLYVDVPSLSIGGGSAKFTESLARVGINYKFSF
ncbi:MAG: outer membrane beta-barrel protein [Xanthobacteraceae bacterium]|nr:outer membrane beta-barrel protein [Xanthobacteraceae bacterium]